MMFRSLKTRVGVLALTATMGVGLVGIASPAGATVSNPKVAAVIAEAKARLDNAKKCTNDGWKTLVRTDQTKFKSQGDCVWYAALGGRPAPPATPKSASQLLCESYGGTFGNTNLIVDPLNPPLTSVRWTCNGWTYIDIPDFEPKATSLSLACGADVANPLSQLRSQGTPDRVVNTTCGVR